MSVLPFAVAIWLFAVGLYGIVTSRNLIHLALCLTVAQSATYVLLLAIGYRSGAVAPVFAGIPLTTKAVDPVVHALAFVDVVVEAVATAILLALAIQAHERFGTLDPDDILGRRG